MTQRKVYLSRRRVNRRGGCASVFITKPENVVFPAGMTLQKNTELKIKPKGQHDSTNQGGLFQATVRQKSPRENTSKREKLVSSNTRKAIGGTPKKKKRLPIAQRDDICKLLCVTVLNSTLTQPVRRKEKLCPHRASEEKRPPASALAAHTAATSTLPCGRRCCLQASSGFLFTARS